MKRLKTSLVVAISLIVLILTWVSAHAFLPEVGPPPYIGGEVKFEVNKSNIEKYKDQLSEGLYRMIKDWDRSIKVYDTVHDYKFPKEYIEATEKYKGTASINKKGGIENYTAGLPFPEPKNGAEAIYNYNFKYNGDDFQFTSYEFRIHSGTGKVRVVRGDYTRLAYKGRVFLDPKPSIPNQEGVELKEISGLSYPEDIAGLALLTVRYLDPSKQDDGYMYIPTIRRVRRISTAQRGDSFGGSDLTWDDYRGFSGKISDYEWKLVGKKNMLVPYHPPVLVVRDSKSMPLAEDLRFELRPVVVVEGTSKSKNYVYSKRRIFLDPDSWGISMTELYDRRGSLWKYGELSLAFDPRNHNLYMNYYGIYDLIAKRSTVIKMTEGYAKKPIQILNRNLKEDLFTTTKIQALNR